MRVGHFISGRRGTREKKFSGEPYVWLSSQKRVLL